MTYLSSEKMAETTLIRGHKLKRGLKLRQQASLIYNKWWSSLGDRFRDGGAKEKRIIRSGAGPKYDRHP